MVSHNVISMDSVQEERQFPYLYQCASVVVVRQGLQIMRRLNQRESFDSLGGWCRMLILMAHY